MSMCKRGNVWGNAEEGIPAGEKRRLALAAIAAVAVAGAMAVARAVAKSDKGLADEVLRAVRETMGVAHREVLGEVE
jgi:TetR/AcrR family transcriptional repressor of nem operon